MDAIYFVSMGSLLGIIFAWVMFLRVKKNNQRVPQKWPGSLKL